MTTNQHPTLDAQCDDAMQRVQAFINRAAGQHKRAITSATIAAANDLVVRHTVYALQREGGAQ